MTGYWRGTFLFYDFEMYRQIIAGDLRAVYTANFSAQQVEMQLVETVIKIPKAQVGGEGPLLAAGFRDVGVDQAEQEQNRIQAGYGYEVADIQEIDAEGWTKEILISGRVSSIFVTFVTGKR
jgi:D-serine deaminase-like pyridoxal phosphate-dependent protein